MPWVQAAEKFELEGPPMVVMIVAALLLGAVVYRPFCQFICPFGFVSWIAERVSRYRIRVAPTRCNSCGACGAACPTARSDSLLPTFGAKRNRAA
jgi:ferredoxin